MTDLPPAEADAAKQFEILADGTMIPVTFTDGRERQVVKVRKMGMAEMPTLSDAMGNEPREIAVYTRNQPDWVKGLDDESFEALIEEGRRLNFTRWEKYFRRQTNLLKAMGQGAVVDAAVNRAIEKALESQSASPK